MKRLSMVFALLALLFWQPIQAQDRLDAVPIETGAQDQDDSSVQDEAPVQDAVSTKKEYSCPIGVRTLVQEIGHLPNYRKPTQYELDHQDQFDRSKDLHAKVRTLTAITHNGRYDHQHASTPTWGMMYIGHHDSNGHRTLDWVKTDKDEDLTFRPIPLCTKIYYTVMDDHWYWEEEYRYLEVVECVRCGNEYHAVMLLHSIKKRPLATVTIRTDTDHEKKVFIVRPCPTPEPTPNPVPSERPCLITYNSGRVAKNTVAVGVSPSTVSSSGSLGFYVTPRYNFSQYQSQSQSQTQAGGGTTTSVQCTGTVPNLPVSSGVGTSPNNIPSGPNDPGHN